MKRILHLSDLHFGRVDPALEPPLLRAIAAARPDLVVISGDLTQRARHSQYRAARAFIDRITAPVLAVPGNHDTPLDNLFVRFLWPFARYRRYINAELEPVHRDGEMLVVGVNTVNRFAWQRGRLSRRRLKRLERQLGDADARLKIVVVHHPLEHDPDTDKSLMRGASRGLAALHEHGADLVLSGHLHQAGAAPFRARPGLLSVQAGTGLSTRLRHDEPNTFNLILSDSPRLAIETWRIDEDGVRTPARPEAGAGPAAASGAGPEFRCALRREWVRKSGQWLETAARSWRSDGVLGVAASDHHGRASPKFAGAAHAADGAERRRPAGGAAV